jgi:phage shock protein A
MERIKLLARTEVSELREKYEDPEKAVNQAIADAMVTYASLKRDSVEVYEAEAQARSRVEQLTHEAERWHKVARKALAAGNEDDARLALSRRQDLLDRLKGPQELYDQAHKVAGAFRKRLAELEDGINQLQAKMALIKAKEVTVRATEAAGEVSSSSSDSTAESLRKREERLDWDLATAEGKIEAQKVAETDPFEELLAATQAASQQAPQAATHADTDVDRALAALREQIKADQD